MPFDENQVSTIKSLAYTEALRAAELVYQQHAKENTMDGEKMQNIQSEPEEESGVNFAWMTNLKAVTDLMIANMKRTFDEYQDLGLTSARNARTAFDKAISDAQQYDNQRQVIANQALQNAVETANMTGKQAVKHADIAADNLWSPVQIGAGDALTARAVTIDDASLKAIGVALAAAVTEALSKTKA